MSSLKNPLDQFRGDLVKILERVTSANGFGRTGIEIKVVRNKDGQRIYALILEGQPSFKYLFSQQNLEEFIDRWRNRDE